MELAVGGVMSVEPRAHAALVLAARTAAAPHAAARVGAGVRVDAGLEPERVDAVHGRLHAVGEALRMEAEDAVLAVSPEKAVVDVDVGVACLLQPVRRHRAGGFEDDCFGDVHAEGVPARPAHERTQLRIARRRNLRRVQETRRTRGDLLAARAFQSGRVHVRLACGEVNADALVAFLAVSELDAGVDRNSNCRQRGGKKREAGRLFHGHVLFSWGIPVYHKYRSCAHEASERCGADVSGYAIISSIAGISMV